MVHSSAGTSTYRRFDTRRRTSGGILDRASCGAEPNHPDPNSTALKHRAVGEAEARTFCAEVEQIQCENSNNITRSNITTKQDDDVRAKS